MKNIRPPKLADRIFEWYCQRAAVEDLHGDMEELFFINLERMSPFKAKAKYWGQILSLIFSYAIKKRKRKVAYHPLSSNANSFSMLQNYFKVATRSLAKQKFFTTINVLGLAIGMSFSLLLVALITYVTTYDTFHTNKDRIYRITTEADDHIRSREYASSPSLLADKLKNEFAGVEEVVRINNTLNIEAQDPDIDATLPLSGYFADPSFLRVFTFPLEKGNSATALEKINSIVITQRAAKKLFGDDDPIGKVITMGQFGDCVVTGLLKDVPKNSHMQFEVLCSYATWENWLKNHNVKPETEWTAFRNNYVYFLMPEHHDMESLQSFLNATAHKAYANNKELTANFGIQSLNAIVPGSELYNQIGPDWDRLVLTIFGALTLMILLPACFNYANISVARALKRSKEIGLRKVVGGQRRQIFFQFIVETVIITLISLVGAYGIFVLVRNEFVSMMVSGDLLDLSTSFSMLLYFIAFALLVGFLAGGIPALYFSKINPVQALKNTTPIKALTGFSFRKVMLVLQFALSLGFIMGVVIVLKQYQSTINYNLGFGKENILDVELQGSNPDLFKSEFDKLAPVQSISMSSGIIGTYAYGAVWITRGQSRDSVEIHEMFVDENYLPNFDLKLINGNNFNRGINNKNFVIVNEQFLKQFKLTESNGLGETFNIPGSGEVSILGVVKDFHYRPLREPISSFFFRYDPNEFRFANLKVTANEMQSAFSDMEAAWKNLGNETMFKSKFMDDEIEEAYSFYFTMIKMCGFLGLLAISISCLGLLGMVVYTAERRTKEIGIRKVMGATVSELTILLSKSYIKMILIGSMIAIPITYFIFSQLIVSMQYYHMDIGAMEIIISFVILLVIGLATIMSQTIRASRANPVDTLRYE